MEDTNVDSMRLAAALMGKAKTEKKAVAARENGKRGGRPPGTGRPLSEETKQRMRAAHQARARRDFSIEVESQSSHTTTK